ncbi:MAG: DUF445 family protein [Fibrobacter sp.]|nr:DUF445 family protein [Fibrobacter sp.]
MRIFLYCSIPVISALIGWLTNYVAVKMIFRPRKVINILGIKIIGLIPKRRQDLAEKIAETVERELISHRDIMAIVQSDDFHVEIGKAIKGKIDSFIESKLSANPLLSMFLSPEITNRLTDTLMEELQKEIPGVIESLFQNVESKLDFRKIIQSKIEAFDINKLESIIFTIASKELKAIEYLGGVLGFIVGLIQLALILIGDLHAQG